LRVFRFEDTSAVFDFGAWCGALPSYVISVDGSSGTPFSPASPYAASATVASCP
jgi:hypothetical protein